MSSTTEAETPSSAFLEHVKEQAATTSNNNNNNNNNNTHLPPQPLVPLRINVSDPDGTARLVDTLILDRTCWPLPISTFDSLEDAVDANALNIAYTLVADMEVHGMGRTVRYFTNRVELWNKKFYMRVVEQVRPQLWEIATTTPLTIPTQQQGGLAAVTLLASKKRHQEATTNETTAKRQKTNDRRQDEEMKEAAMTTEDNDKDEHKAKPEPTTSNNTISTTTNNITSAQPLIPIHLHLYHNQVRIQDDFVWDPSLPQEHQPCPIALAQTLGKDLNVPDEVVVALATSLVEQMNRQVVTAVVPEQHAKKTAAWKVDHRVHSGYLGQVLSAHRPSVNATTAASGSK